MQIYSTLWVVLETLALVSITAHAANWNTDVGILVTERLDPIVSPNAVASHMHSIIGGSGFGAAYNQADLMKSACSTFPISVDKSNYWHPTPYWINNNGSSFTPLPMEDRVYYIREQNSPNEAIQPFPEGLRMIVGNPMAKSGNGRSFQFLCRVSAEFDGPEDIWSDNWQFGRDCPRGVLVCTFPSSVTTGLMSGSTQVPALLERQGLVQIRPISHGIPAIRRILRRLSRFTSYPSTRNYARITDSHFPMGSWRDRQGQADMGKWRYHWFRGSCRLHQRVSSLDRDLADL
jgi:hypothetical protein